MVALTRTQKQAWILLLVLSLFARLVGLGHRAVSHDESLHALYSWYLSQGRLYQHDPMMHGPLLFHLNGFLFRFLPVTDFTARLIPALLGTGCVALLLPFRRWLGNWGAFCAAVLVSLDPGHLFYSRYLRNDITITLVTLIMVWAVLRYRERPSANTLLWLSFGLAVSFTAKEVCFIHGVMLGAGCVGFSLLDTFYQPDRSWKTWLRHPWMQCAMLILLLALPFATGVLLPEGQWSPPGAINPEIQQLGIRLGLGIMAGTLLIGTAYFTWLHIWKAWIFSALLFWWIQFSLYTSFFQNIRGGIASGLAGSLGYWWAQHDVQRGNSDPAFYFTLLLLYTPVLLLGILIAGKRFRERPIAFILFWAALHFALYSWAGERMPWLLLHISLPLCILTGAVLPGIFQGRRWPQRILQGVLVLGLFQLLINSLRLAGPNAEGPWEPMVFAHSGEEVKSAFRIAERHLQDHPGTRIQIDPGYSWPTAWYFRETPAGYEAISTPDSVSEESSAIMVAPGKRSEFQAAGWISRGEYNLTTWPRQRYHRISKQNLINLFRHSGVRSTFVRYYLTRDQPEWREGEFPGPNRFLLMTRSR